MTQSFQRNQRIPVPIAAVSKISFFFNDVKVYSVVVVPQVGSFTWCAICQYTHRAEVLIYSMSVHSGVLGGNSTKLAH